VLSVHARRASGVGAGTARSFHEAFASSRSGQLMYSPSDARSGSSIEQLGDPVGGSAVSVSRLISDGIIALGGGSGGDGGPTAESVSSSAQHAASAATAKTETREWPSGAVREPMSRLRLSHAR